MSQSARVAYETRPMAGADPFTDYLEWMLRAQRAGAGVLPFDLGLSADDCRYWVRRCLPHCLDLLDPGSAESFAGWDKGRLRGELLTLRQDEWEELRQLLLANRSGRHELEVPLAAVVAAGSLGGDHLWRDLGLPSRAELGQLLHGAFGPLASLNVFDMKWKKFFYRQLCETGGQYVCRSPSCEECTAYADCFGSEE